MQAFGPMAIAAAQFPINRRHQGLATAQAPLGVTVHGVQWFPINRRHQGLATGRMQAEQAVQRLELKFPINRRHQGLATGGLTLRQNNPVISGFQSIGVTKDWRPFRHRLASGDSSQSRVSNQ